MGKGPGLSDSDYCDQHPTAAVRCRTSSRSEPLCAALARSHAAFPVSGGAMKVHGIVDGPQEACDNASIDGEGLEKPQWMLIFGKKSSDRGG
jgi:hypothetical protein